MYMMSEAAKEISGISVAVVLGVLLAIAIGSGCEPVNKVESSNKVYCGTSLLENVDFNGHKYIIVRYERGIGICHDESCMCIGGKMKKNTVGKVNED